MAASFCFISSPKSLNMQVNEVLPRRFFTRLGRYVATIGHLEACIRRTICLIRGWPVDPSDEKFAELCELGIEDLLTALNKAFNDLEPDLRSYIRSRVAHMQKFKTNRHLAIHGAWEYRDPNFILRVKPKKQVKFEHVVTWQDIENALEDADRLLSEMRDVEDYITRPSSAR